jgi:sortase A
MLKKYNENANTGSATPTRAAASRKTKKKRLILLIAGIALIIAALAFIGQAVYNILDANFETDESLAEAKQMIKEMSVPENETASASPSGADASASDSPAPADVPGPLVNRKAGDVLGIIVFDTLDNREVPIIEGAKPAQLKKGAGHHPDMSYPGQVGNCLLFGHRNTVFSDFGKLKKGDTIQIKTEYGTFTYEISDMQVTFPLDPLMFKGYNEPMLTLVTCYPFHYVGAAPKRYVVVCKMTDSSK